jgi:hypothetical protein
MMLRVLLGVLALLALLPNTAQAQRFSADIQSHKLEAAPGDELSGTFGVSNFSSEPVTLNVLTGDWVREFTTESGTVVPYAFKEGHTGQEARSLVEWITFSPDKLTLEPGAEALISYRVEVPDDQELSGSYWGLFFIEEGKTEEEIKTEPAPDTHSQVGIKVKFRYILKIYVTIEDSAVAEPQFEAVEFSSENGNSTARSTIANPGPTFLMPTLIAQIRDAAGNVVYQSEEQKTTILPESSRTVAVGLPGLELAAAEYLLLLILDYGEPQLLAAQTKLTFHEPLVPEPKRDSTAEPGDGAGGADASGVGTGAESATD